MVLNLAKCSECGQGVPTDARTLGLCPRCLMRSALVGGSGSAAFRGGLRNFDPPDADDLGGLLVGLEVIELIGRGGMGFVYKARQRSLDRPVAVKLFPREAYEDPSFAERFANEARILANLSHPNIVAAYEFGESSCYCHLVMELIAGQSLRQRIERGPMPQVEAVDIARQVCDALEYAHGRGVIHRDIKPENIMLEERASGGVRVRVADFGLAKLIQRRPTDFSMTAPNRLMGTPDYMAPEQRQKPNEVDARADVYALGVVLYEMLTGQLPLGRFAPPAADARLNRVVLRCLETLPQNRYAGVADVRRELESLGARGPTTVWKMAVGAATLAMIAAGAIFIFTHRGPGPEQKGDPRPMASTGPATAPTTRATPSDAVTINDRPPVDRPVVVNRVAPPPADHPTFPFPPPSDVYTLVPENMARIPGRFPFDRVPPTRDNFYDRMVRDHGVNRVVRVFVDNVSEGNKQEIFDRLKVLSGATSTIMSRSNATLSIYLAPVPDLDALVKNIDFGKVTAVDPQKRVIDVTAAAPKTP
jgi:serine/threonine protein kinase